MCFKLTLAEFLVSSEVWMFTSVLRPQPCTRPLVKFCSLAPIQQTSLQFHAEFAVLTIAGVLDFAMKACVNALPGFLGRFVKRFLAPRIVLRLVRALAVGVNVHPLMVVLIAPKSFVPKTAIPMEFVTVAIANVWMDGKAEFVTFQSVLVPSLVLVSVPEFVNALQASLATHAPSLRVIAAEMVTAQTLKRAPVCRGGRGPSV